MRTFEDFAPGATFAYGGELVTREAIFDFARRYDPQPMHLDEEAAKTSLLGGLAASGLHTNSLLSRMTAQHLLADTACLGIAGIKEFRWFRPVRPDETLSVKAEVLDARASRSRPEMGLVTFRFDVSADAGDRVLTLDGTLMFARREPGNAAVPSQTAPFILPPERYRVGRFTFTEENIVAYAREFDPKPFHIDRAVAERSHFGGLVASGWHIACVNVAVALATGSEPERKYHPKRSSGRRGPSPGWRDVRWWKPVRPGEAIDFYRFEAGYRGAASRPGWGVLDLGSTAENERGEVVFSALSALFVQHAS